MERSANVLITWTIGDIQTLPMVKRSFTNRITLTMVVSMDLLGASLCNKMNGLSPSKKFIIKEININTLII